MEAVRSLIDDTMIGNDDEEQVDGLSDEERHLRADLEEIWQAESPMTAKVTDLADEVDGELGTRPSADL
jgi:hypothetical protein